MHLSDSDNELVQMVMVSNYPCLRLGMENTDILTMDLDALPFKILNCSHCVQFHQGVDARGNHHWHIVYPSNRHTDGHGTIRSVILANANISTDVYAT